MSKNPQKEWKIDTKTAMKNKSSENWVQVKIRSKWTPLQIVFASKALKKTKKILTNSFYLLKPISKGVLNFELLARPNSERTVRNCYKNWIGINGQFLRIVFKISFILNEPWHWKSTARFSFISQKEKCSGPKNAHKTKTQRILQLFCLLVNKEPIETNWTTNIQKQINSVNKKGL